LTVSHFQLPHFQSPRIKASGGSSLKNLKDSVSVASVCGYAYSRVNI